MGKRKERVQYCEISAQKVNPREFADSDVWMRWKAASLELKEEEQNPNPKKQNPKNPKSKNVSRIIDVVIHIYPEEGKDTNETRVIIREPVVLDESPEASRMKMYATYAFYHLAKGPHKLHINLLQIGPLSVGEFSKTQHILHLNLKAKYLNDDDGDVDVEKTFFCELTETTRGHHVSLLNYCCVALSHLLPEKAATCGCLYCSGCNIHHPQVPHTFLTGGEPYKKALASKIHAIRTYLRKRKCGTKAAFIKRFPDPGLVYIDDETKRTTGIDNRIDEYSRVALRMYNRKQGSNYEFVKIGEHEVNYCRFGIIFHLNFEARNKDKAGVVDSFFAQVINNCEFYLVDFCSCLGPTSNLPGEPDRQGCVGCCKREADVHHSPGPGYLRGWECNVSRPF